MNIIQNKLRSGKGASITFALLLFLVCAVLSSIILAAASTASGRMAGMAKADQRYYSVTSACEIIKDIMDGEKATAVQVQEKEGSSTTTRSYIYPGIEGGEAEVRAVKKEGAEVSDPFTASSLLELSAYRYWNNLTGPIEIEIENLPSGADVTVVEKVNNSTGDVTFTVSKGENGKNPFAMKITFSTDVVDETSTKTIGGKTLQIQTMTMKWSLKNMKVITATGAAS